MGEQEMFQAQGRAYADAKRLRSEIATATTEAKRTIAVLTELARRSNEALADPMKCEPQKPIQSAIRLVHDLRFEMKDTLNALATFLDEVYMKSGELKKLDEQIRNF